MKKKIYRTILFGFLSILPFNIGACPFCVGRLDKEHKIPPFFSEQYDQHWQLSDIKSSSLNQEVKQEHAQGESHE